MENLHQKMCKFIFPFKDTYTHIQYAILRKRDISKFAVKDKALGLISIYVLYR